MKRKKKKVLGILKIIFFKPFAEIIVRVHVIVTLKFNIS